MTGDRFHTLFKSGRTLDLSYRRNALRTLQKKVSENRKGLAKYMMEDLDTGKIESAFFYLSAVEMRIRSALYLTGAWMPKQHKKGKFPAAVFGKGKAYNEPVGVILLAPDPREPFLPWFSFYLASLSAGNCTVLRFAGRESQTASCIMELANASIPDDFGTILIGDEEMPDLMPDKTFGGNSAGKCVAVLDGTRNLDRTAMKIVKAWKCNAGITGISPEAVLLPMPLRNRFIRQLDLWNHRIPGEGNPRQLQVLGYETGEDLMKALSGNGTALALYVFAKDEEFCDEIFLGTEYLEGCQNGTGIRPAGLPEQFVQCVSSREVVTFSRGLIFPGKIKGLFQTVSTQ